jgi:glycosyltransferase 2 family protein
MNYIKKLLKNKWLKLAAKIVVSLAFLAYVIMKVKWLEVWQYLQDINPFIIILYLIIILAGVAISSKKWQLLVNSKNINLSFTDAFKYYLTGTFLNNFLPSIIGSDTFRSYQVGRRYKKYSEAISTVIMDRITGLAAAMLMAILFSILNYKQVFANPILLVVNCLIVLSFCFDFAVFSLRKSPLGKKIIAYFPEKVANFLMHFRDFQKKKGVMKNAILYGIAFDFVGLAIANYLLFASLGLKIGILDYLSVIFIISIISSFPVSINNIGIKEWSYITFFGIFGLNTSAVTTIAILSRFLQILLSLTAFPLYIKFRKK